MPQAFLQWLLSSQYAEALLWGPGSEGSKCALPTFPPSHLGERGMGDGNALRLGIFSVPTTKLYNHPLRSGLSLREGKKLASGCTANE